MLDGCINLGPGKGRHMFQLRCSQKPVPQTPTMSEAVSVEDLGLGDLSSNPRFGESG